MHGGGAVEAGGSGVGGGETRPPASSGEESPRQTSRVGHRSPGGLSTPREGNLGAALTWGHTRAFCLK